MFKNNPGMDSLSEIYKMQRDADQVRLDKYRQAIITAVDMLRAMVAACELANLPTLAAYYQGIIAVLENGLK